MINKKTLTTCLLLLSITACTVTKTAASSDANTPSPEINICFKNILDTEEIKKKFAHLSMSPQDQGIATTGIGMCITEDFFNKTAKKVYNKDLPLQDMNVKQLCEVINRALKDNNVQYTCVGVYDSTGDNMAKDNEKIFDDMKFLIPGDRSGKNSLAMKVSNYSPTNDENISSKSVEKIIIVVMIALIAASFYYYFTSLTPQKNETQVTEHNTNHSATPSTA